MYFQISRFVCKCKGGKCTFKPPATLFAEAEIHANPNQFNMLSTVSFR